MPWERPTLLGVDVSNWQKEIDWAAVAASGRVFALIKASEDPAYRDPWFGPNWRGAKAAGLAVGAYHFAQPDHATPDASVGLLAEQLGAVGGLAAGDMVALDIEAGTGDLLSWVIDWCAACEERLGVVPILYSGHWFMEPHGLESALLGHRYPLWYASYQATPPPPPTGFDRIAFWQFTAHGQVPGITGDADENLFNGTAEELRAVGKAGAGPDPITTALDGIWAQTEHLAAIEHAGIATEIQRKVVDLKNALGR